MKEDLVLRVNPLVDVHPFDDDTKHDAVLCEVPDGTGGARRYTLPESLMRTLDLFDGSRTIAEVRSKVNGPGVDVSWTKLRKLVEGYLLPRKVLVRTDDEDPYAEVKEARGEYMQVRFETFSSSTVVGTSNLLTWLFQPYVAAGAVMIAAAAAVWFFAFIEPNYTLTVTEMSGGQFLITCLIMLFGSCVHEFGHAAASVRYGCKSVSIGWGWYLYFFVLYTDLSEAWRLPRKERAIVDVGGLYFQSIYATLLLLAYGVWGAPVFLYCVLFSYVSMISALNPFIRLDGYWLLSDLGGIPNLRQTSIRFFRRAWDRFWNPDAADDGFEPTRRMRWITGLYAVTSFTFFGGLGILLYDRLFLDLIQNYPGEVWDIGVRVAGWTPHTSWAETGTLIGSTLDVLWQGVVAFFVWKIVLQGLYKLLAWAYYKAA